MLLWTFICALLKSIISHRRKSRNNKSLRLARSGSQARKINSQKLNHSYLVRSDWQLFEAVGSCGRLVDLAGTGHVGVPGASKNRQSSLQRWVGGCGPNSSNHGFVPLWDMWTLCRCFILGWVELELKWTHQLNESRLRKWSSKSEGDAKTEEKRSETYQ